MIYRIFRVIVHFHRVNNIVVTGLNETRAEIHSHIKEIDGFAAKAGSPIFDIFYVSTSFI